MARSNRYKIIYQDRDIIAVSKPVGLLCVPIKGSNVTNLLDQLISDFRHQTKTIHIVHRIDRFTSGIVIFAKNQKARRGLISQFRRHQPVRTYLALVRGLMKKDNQVLVHHMKRVKKGFRNVVVSSDDAEATKARLVCRVKERFPDTTLVEIDLDTGLKNQIRVQLAEIGHTIVGDRHYDPKEKNEKHINRQALHAYRLQVIHPATGKTMKFEAPVPSDMKKLIEFYRTHKTE